MERNSYPHPKGEQECKLSNNIAPAPDPFRSGGREPSCFAALAHEPRLQCVWNTGSTVLYARVKCAVGRDVNLRWCRLASSILTVTAWTIISKLAVAKSIFPLAGSAPTLSKQPHIPTKTPVSRSEGFTFGLAVPKDITTDFIGQISASVTEGWVGVSLTGSMAGALLIAAYPNDDSVVSGLREASAYANPAVFDGDATLTPIADGTYVNGTAFTYTFLCSNCILSDGRSFTASDAAPILGWAMSNTPIADPSSTSSVLNYHNKFGLYSLDLEAAKSADFATWAAMASSDTPSTPSVPGNGTTTSPATNTTVPVTVLNTTYDYIIAGAGAAGIIVAQKIAEKGHSVLLLERGAASYHSTGGELTMPWNDTVSPFDVPGVSFYLSEIDGGGTAVNGLNWVRPAQRDFDDKWPAGWRWADVMRAADRVYERNPGTILPSADGKYYDQAAYDVLSQHFTANGWSSDDAIQHPDNKHLMFGHTTYNISMKTNTQESRGLENFKLQLNTKVIRAVRSNSTITGVEVESDNARQIINVNPGGRVILASGSMSTPRILFNSGIGPASQIQTVQSGSTAVTLPAQSAWIDLPVGKRLMDHPIWWTKWKVNGGMANMTSLSSENLVGSSPQMTELFAKGMGPLVQSDQRLDFSTDVTNKDGSVRYIQGTCLSQTNGTVSIIVYLTHGLTSTGELGITANGATEFVTKPWMNTDGDVEAVEGFMDTLLAYSRKPGGILTYDGASNTTGKEMLADLQMTSSNHYLGTTRMGTDDGRDGGDAVVDLDTKVYGTDNLFVVDGSIHTDVPTGNTKAMIYVVAEKAAEKIMALGNSSVSKRRAIIPKRRSSESASLLQLRSLRSVPGNLPIRPMLDHGRIVAASN
ncbi:Uu.00g009580.m01.CDS01 [Anthostomella pinea]|uniref:Uu.00g009580.m01.CDS01 n=1 Tax=Anthostomella pinea TaxID=933095 RepID=A0AAI8VY26_9PEZI|nr:Uu.00g009580.m01.CDS01 [Anthostomella pinea]